MKQAINIFTVLALVAAIIDSSMDLLPKLGLSETAITWVKLAGLLAVGIVNFFKPKN